MSRNNLVIEDAVEDQNASINCFTNETFQQNNSSLSNSTAKFSNKSKTKKGLFVAIILGILVITLVQTNSEDYDKVKPKSMYSDYDDTDSSTIAAGILKNNNDTAEKIQTEGKITEKNQDSTTENNKIDNKDLHGTDLSSPTYTTEIINTEKPKTKTEQINLMRDCLKGVLINRNYENDASVTPTCNQNDNTENLIEINKVRIAMGTSSIFNCLILPIKYNCQQFINDEITEHIKNHNLKDLYFNYIIGLNNEIYEGRPLNCNFDEDSLKETHKSTLVIGIPECKYLKDSDMVDRKEQFFSDLIRLLECLQKKGLLIENYQIEWHKDCQEILIPKQFEGFLENRISYLNDNSLIIEKKIILS